MIPTRIDSATRGFGGALALLAAIAGSTVAAEPVAAVVTGGRTFALEAPGLGRCTGGFSARVVIGGRDEELTSTAGEVVRFAPTTATEATPEGPATVTESTIRFDRQPVELLLRLGRIDGVPGVLLQAGIVNRGTEPVRLVSVTPATLEVAVAGDPSEWLVTALDESILHARPTTPLAEITDPLTIREYGGLYRRDGVGFVFGPVGEPVAFVDARVSCLPDDRVSFVYRSDMSGVRVDPGETRWGQQVALLLEPPQRALARWAAWVGATHGARTRLGALSGWNSWAFLGGEVSGADVLAVVDDALRMPDRLRPAVIQIDGGYEDPSGERESNERFPEGLTFYAEKIAATGARPGLLLPERAPADGRLLGWHEVADRAGAMVRKGYSYIKLNTQGITRNTAGTDRQTVFEAVRAGFAEVREAVGDDTYLLNNDFAPNRAAVGHVDAHRTGLDAKRLSLRPCADDVLRSYHLQGRWGAVDNDSYFLGTEVANVSAIDGGWPLVRTWASMVGMSGGSAITSDPWYWESFRPFLRNVETMTPPVPEPAEVLDLCTQPEYSRLVERVGREWGDATLALLWNPGSTERVVSLELAEAGLAADRRYAVWSFWDNRFLGVAKGSWSTPTLAPSASQHLRFTDLDQAPNRPVLIGSSLHISCGTAEIERVTSLQAAMEIELTDAGARDGDIFVYSRLAPMLTAATGCTVEKIAYAGENVWRIAVAGRERGGVQRVELGITLPLTQQAWFWLLVGVAAISLMLAAWRFLASFRLEREHALQRERARIAHDLHDTIGASLAQIGLLTGQAEAADDDRDERRSHLDRIFRVSHATAKELNAVVWAVDPANDTLEDLARYIHGYAEDFLGTADIRCHFASTEEMPPIRVSSTVRHHLLMVAKEAIHNAVEHSDATVVTLRIALEGSRIMLEVADDGCGLPPEGVLNPGNGLGNMRLRAAELGGTCEFLVSVGGRGTVVRLTVPVKPQSAAFIPASDTRS